MGRLNSLNNSSLTKFEGKGSICRQKRIPSLHRGGIRFCDIQSKERTALISLCSFHMLVSLSGLLLVKGQSSVFVFVNRVHGADTFHGGTGRITTSENMGLRIGVNIYRKVVREGPTF